MWIFKQEKNVVVVKGESVGLVFIIGVLCNTWPEVKKLKEVLIWLRWGRGVRARLSLVSRH